MSNKSYGLGYERKEKKYWQDKSYYAHRARGSFGLFDLIVTSRYLWRLISVKSTKQKYYSYKKEIEELEAFGINQVPRGTIKMLILYHKGKRKILYERVI